MIHSSYYEYLLLNVSSVSVIKNVALFRPSCDEEFRMHSRQDIINKNVKVELCDFLCGEDPSDILHQPGKTKLLHSLVHFCTNSMPSY